jgi:hypothetical protein
LLAFCPFGVTGETGEMPPFDAAAVAVSMRALAAQTRREKSFRTAGWHSTNVSEGAERELTRVELPPHVGAAFEVYVNGVPQVAGRDYELRGRTLVFSRALAREGKLGFWRWLSLFLGVAGTYRQNDSVDVIYDAGGRRVVASGLVPEPQEQQA